jgi:protein required for attachment to host cells
MKVRRWYVVANRTASVFYAEGRFRKFHFVDRITEEQGATHEHELVSDRPGRSFSSAGDLPRHGLQRRNTQHEEIARRFARKIAAAIEAARREDLFEELVLAAEPHFLGLLRAELTAATRARILRSVPREFTRGSETEVRAQLLRSIRAE